MPIDAVNALSEEAFVDRFGFLFEHSPWIVARAAQLRPFAGVEAMHAALMAVVAAAGDDAQLALLRAHPQLADKVAIAEGLTRESAAEQAAAGLDRLTPEEFQIFHARNAAYFERFGFPFIVCVRLTDKAGILAAMAERVTHTPEAERAAALAEVAKIVRLRLEDTL